MLDRLRTAIATIASGLRRALSGLSSEQRLALAAVVAMLVTLILPWYTKSTMAAVGGKQPLQAVSQQKPALFVPSFVEASILLVALALIVLLLARGRGARFALPTSDGRLVAAGGIWIALLVFWRFVDQPTPPNPAGGAIQTQYELSWGIFFGLLAAAGVIASGLRLDAGTRPPGEGPRERSAATDYGAGGAASAERPASPGVDGEAGASESSGAREHGTE